VPYQDLQIELDGGVCWLTLDRPEQMNALTPEMGDGLVSALEQSVQGVFLLMALAAGVGVSVVPLLPGGRAAEHARSVARGSAPYERVESSSTTG